MKAVSPWAASAFEIDNKERVAIYTRRFNDYVAELCCIHNTAWIIVTTPGGTRLSLRCAYSPTTPLELEQLRVNENEVRVKLNAGIGDFTVTLQFPNKEKALLRYTSELKPYHSLFIPFWPRDLTVLGLENDRKLPEGTVHVAQEGTRSGLQFFSLEKPESGTVFYMQNLTALNDYFEITGTSAASTVGGQWPELGFALPQTKDKPMPASASVIISDAFLFFNKNKVANEFDIAKQFLDGLAIIYLHLPRPETKYHDWPDILEKGLDDLQNNHGCWSHAGGNDYLNAYLCDYNTPPEIMVQLAILLPLLDYRDWSKKNLPAIKKIKKGIKAFYNKDIGSVVRWLPSLEKDLDGSEEQLKPNVMDSWYLHHPLLNLSRLALQGDKDAEKLFLDSLPFAIKVARHFKYEWPVFYDLETLEIIKEETAVGKGGEKDVAGLYAHVMLQAWELTRDKVFLIEAEKAAKTLKGKGFDLFYQANNTAFSANAMIRLYKETGKKLYLDLGNLCLASIFKNVHLWECNYGYAKDYSTFFGVYPLNDAPYTAAYEEQEVFAAFHDYIKTAGEDILPSVILLIAEFMRYVLQRAAYYYPPNLPAEMMAEKVKMGQVDKKLYIAVEDINDGWVKSGSVGQEVYGAGVAFGIVPRHFYRIPDESFMIYIDYPTTEFYEKDSFVSFKVGGDERLTCRLLIIKKDDRKMPVTTVSAVDGKKEIGLKGEITNKNHVEYQIKGNQFIKVKWTY